MRITYIMTDDGPTRVEWWPEEKFRGRVIGISSVGGDGIDATAIPVPDDSILCDLCNAEITEFPVPVLWGTHAVCEDCYIGVQKGGKT